FLLSLWGLRYTLMDVNPLGIQNGILELRVVEEDEIVRTVHPRSGTPFMRPDGIMPYMLRDFVREHMIQLRKLVDDYHKVLHNPTPCLRNDALEIHPRGGPPSPAFGGSRRRERGSPSPKPVGPLFRPPDTNSRMYIGCFRSAQLNSTIRRS